MSEEPGEQQENRKEQEEPSQLQKLEQALNLERQRSEDYLTRLKYRQADLENLKKQFERQMDEARKYSNERLIVELLDIVDELEMAIESARFSNSEDALVRGVEMTLKKLRNILKKEGVSPIDSLGKPFDPSKHNAVARMEKEGVENCTIVEELRKGYVMKEKVIRPSIVKVAVKPSSKSQTEMSSNE